MPLALISDMADLVGSPAPPGRIAILPVAATEAHGPHLPLTTDCDIARGHIDALAPYLSSAIDAVVLPLQRIGASREHARLPGTQSREEADLIADWFAIARHWAEAGGRRLVVVSSHGGNTAVVDSVVLKARAELDMLAVATAWLRFGQPEGLFSPEERRYGIHGGDVETSLMLHYAPETVDMAKARIFASRLEALEGSMSHLSAYGPHRFGWLSTDLNPAGVVGDARAATPEKGAALADHILTGFALLLDDVARFDIDWLT